jgi:preprotein translocase subunit SecE
MAVAEAKKLEKGDSGGPSAPAWLSGAFGWGPRKFRELRAFLSEVRAELKKVTWPARTEVYTTTVVVIITTIFFGFYLYAVDILFSRALTLILK